MDDKYPPPAEARTEHHGDRELILGMLGAHFRELTSNLMRVLRGAGKPYDIIRQTALVLEWLKRHETDCGTPVNLGDLQSLVFVPLDRSPHERGADGARSRAIDDIVNGALQVAASRLVGQSHFEQRGEEEIIRGIAAYQDAMKDRNAHRTTS